MSFGYSADSDWASFQKRASVPAPSSTRNRLTASLRPAATLVAGLPALAIDEVDGRRFRQGQPLLVPGRPDGECAVFEGDRLLGVAAVAAGVARPRRVVAERARGEAGPA